MYYLKAVRKTNNNYQGFTLIELMIVMVIVALLMSLVGPLTIKSYEKVQAKEEMLSLKGWIKGNSYRSFATAQQGEITLSEQSIAFTYIDKNARSDANNDLDNINGDPIASRSFKYLSFARQKIAVNTFGLVTPNSITVQLNGNDIQLIISENTSINQPNND
jgi:prepilin-type N-terminal cleavage/methylation domain-containing protein